jgi:hypothetical protein
MASIISQEIVYWFNKLSLLPTARQDNNNNDNATAIDYGNAQ